MTEVKRIEAGPDNPYKIELLEWLESEGHNPHRVAAVEFYIDERDGHMFARYRLECFAGSVPSFVTLKPKKIE